MGIFIPIGVYGCLVTSFSCPPWFIPWALLGSCGTGLSSAYCFIHPNEIPFIKTYSHEAWDFGDGSEFPILRISKNKHGKGKTPYVEFAQGNFTFPIKIDKNGDVSIIRDNHSIGRFKDIEIIIRKKRL